MKTSHKAAALISFVLIFVSHGLLAQEKEAPEFFESVPANAPNAYEFAKQCLPTVSESSFSRMVSDSGDKSTTSLRPSDKTQPYLVVALSKVYCVRMSDRKYPLLPLAAFTETIEFPEMSKEDAVLLKLDLSRQLAKSGFATALVVNETGNANQVVYLLASDRPTKFYYHNNFMKKGEFAESAFPKTYTAKGGVTVTARGQPADQVKYFFSR